ncbi:MAG: serine hydrolase domain-containing protein [Pseudomonadota bacterium]
MTGLALPTLLLGLLGAQAEAGEALLTRLAAIEALGTVSGVQVSLLEGGLPAGGFAHGFAQLTPDGPVTLTRAHKVRVASISKPFVAIAAMQLVEAEKLNLDGDVSEVLGWSLRNPAFPEVPITLRQLLSHTSSVRDADRYFIRNGEGRLREFFEPETVLWADGGHFASDQPPGTYFAYSNLNFGVVATLLERASGERFDRLMRNAVLAPLDVDGSFSACDVPRQLRAAGFRKRDAKEVWDPEGPWVAQVDGGEPACYYGGEPGDRLGRYALGDNATLFSPQGGLRASADDLTRLLQVLLGRETALLSATTVAAMRSPQWALDPSAANGLSSGEAPPGGDFDGFFQAFGLSVHLVDVSGWGLKSDIEQLIGHFGEAYGVLGFALADPVSGDGIAALITGTSRDPAVAASGSTPLYRIEEEILRWWLEQRTTATHASTGNDRVD